MVSSSYSDNFDQVVILILQSMLAFDNIFDICVLYINILAKIQHEKFVFPDEIFDDSSAV